MTQIVTEIQGEVASVSQKAERYGVKIGDVWYNGFGNCPVRRGDSVVLAFYERNGYKNVKGIRLLKSDEESVLTDEEAEHLHQKMRLRNCRIAEESIEDARQLAANSGIRAAATPGNIFRIADRLIERLTPHASRTFDEYVRQKRIAKRKAVQAVPDEAAEANASVDGEGI